MDTSLLESSTSSAPASASALQASTAVKETSEEECKHQAALTVDTTAANLAVPAAKKAVAKDKGGKCDHHLVTAHGTKGKPTTKTVRVVSLN